MRTRTYRYFTADFETTVYKGQTDTEVWAAAIVELYTEDVSIFHSIGDFFEYLYSLNTNLCILFHNVKFDGSFIVWYLLSVLKYSQATEKTGEGEYDIRFVEDKYMKNDSFKYMISEMGQWYTITVKHKGNYIQFRDSYKLLPFSIKSIGDSFKTMHKKLDMKYEGFRYAGCDITPEEQEYIKNDVLVAKEAVEIMFNEGHNKLTIGSCCMQEFKIGYTKELFEKMFPNLYELGFEPTHDYGSQTVGEYIRKSYKGGWCYIAKGKENKIYHNGLTLDVNSLYPSVMSDQSGNEYPYGLPTFWIGNKIPEEALQEHRYFFIRFKTRFKLKPNMLPTVQIKGDLKYKATEWLETSDFKNRKTGQYSRYLYEKDGTRYDSVVTLTMTMTDYALFLEHYYVSEEFEILDGCWFNSTMHMFEDYIFKYKIQKMNSTGARRTLAKLFLNNLYGKMATSIDSSFKYAYIRDDGSLGFITIEEYDKKPGYIPCGSAITSYARNFTIRAAQKNYYGVNKRGFIYADTDSLHMDLNESELKDIPIHSTEFCHWKLESQWDYAIFARQKTYIEHVTHDGHDAIEPHNDIKCAGMPEHCKDLLQISFDGWDFDNLTKEQQKIYDKLDDDEKKFVRTKRTINDFKVGLKVPGKLIPRQIKGGVLLVKEEYTMRERGF